MAKKEKKVKEPKIFKSAVAPDGKFNQEYVDRLHKIQNMIKQRTTCNDAIRQEHAEIKKVFNIPAYASRYEVKMRLMDPETRTEIERTIEISRRMSGVQLSMDLVVDNRSAGKIVSPVVGGNPVEEAQKMMAH